MSDKLDLLDKSNNSNKLVNLDKPRQIMHSINIDIINHVFKFSAWKFYEKPYDYYVYIVISLLLSFQLILVLFHILIT